MDVNGKVALVTGACSGLGLGTCEALQAAGAKVVAFDRDAEGLARLTERHPDWLTKHVDVTDEASVKAGISEARGALGAVHIVVNCAGVADAAKTISRGEPFPLSTWQKVIGINLTGTFNMIRFGALAMSENEPDAATGERGVIVNTASGAATQGQVGQAAYSASKAGVVGMTLPVARDLAGLGIRVVTISPGLFETQMVAGFPPNVTQALVDRMILFPNRMGQPSEFASLVCHIVENVYLNATTIDLDAGARMAAR